ncbi:MAG: UDP-3-O-(3-hydroxymyristoyl)glucosamine N-acyltransferase [Gemmatimonadota bacterium]|nr:UDP-3-O-(3-hydroxymyristoyl)glucosamine N-acyltransferase [Gemmatimonadota bacterium]
MSDSLASIPASYGVERIIAAIGESVRDVIGSRDRSINHPSPIGMAEGDAITFCTATGTRAAELLGSTHAGVVICSPEISATQLPQLRSTLITTDQPRLAFIRVVADLFANEAPRGVHPTAVIDSSVRLPSAIYVGPLTTIGPKCSIGNGTVIHGGVHIYSDTQIGANVTIHAGTVIGADGFGYQRNDDGRLEKFPHLGGVIIEDDVEIGANTCIDRGTLEPTLIREGAKIDNLVHIAHNVDVGRHAAVIAHAMVGGGTRIGDYGWVAPCACLRDGISIGAKATVGLGAVVTRDVPDRATVMGSPARDAAEYRATLEALKNLAAKE